MSKNSRIHDISLTLEEGVVAYPKDVAYGRTLQRDLNKGDSSNVSVVETSAHAGTHVDAPRHYFSDGYGIDEIPLGHLYGRAFVADCRGLEAVTADVLADIVPGGTERLLLKTDNSQWLHNDPRGPFRADFVYLDAGGADFCVERGIVLVGIDYLSIDKSGCAAKPAHKTLLRNNITILEGIVLAEIDTGEHFLACGPLKMADADGAPARAVLIELPLS